MAINDLPVDQQSLRDADRQLAALADVALEQDGEVPAWVLAARQAVTHYRHEVDTHEG